MTFTVSPVDPLFPVAVVDEAHPTAARQHAEEEARRRRHRLAEAEAELSHAAKSEAAADAPPDPESHPTTGRLIDVKG